MLFQIGLYAGLGSVTFARDAQYPCRAFDATSDALIDRFADHLERYC